MMSSEQKLQTARAVPASRRPRDRSAARPRDLTERLNVFAKAAVWAVVIALIGIAAFGQFYDARFSGLVSTTAMEIGDVARQLRYGEGFSTQVIRLPGLTYGQPNEEGVVPEMLHAPLYAYLLSWLFRLRGGGGDAAVALFNGLMFLLTGGVIYAIARLLWDRVVALLSVAVYFVSVDAIGLALTAAGASLAGLLLTIAIWAALRNRQTTPTSPEESQAAARVHPLVWPALIGGAFGLTYLAGLTSLVLVIPLAVLATATGPRRRQQVALIAGVAAVVMLPWAVRNLQVSGTVTPALAKYVLLTHTDTYPGESVFQQMPDQVLSPIAFVLQHPGEILKKFGGGVIMLYRRIPDLLNPYLFPFLIMGGFVFAHGSLKRSLWRVVIAMFALQILSISVYRLDINGIGLLLPIAICLAVGTLVEALRRTEASRLVQILVGAIMFSLVLFPAVSSAIVGGKMPANQSLASLGIIRDRLSEDAVIASDNPSAVAWYTHKQAVALPTTPAGLDELAQRGVKVDYVYLSHVFGAQLGNEATRPWNEALRSREGRKSLGKFMRLPYGEMLIDRFNKLETQ